MSDRRLVLHHVGLEDVEGPIRPRLIRFFQTYASRLPTPAEVKAMENITSDVELMDKIAMRSAQESGRVIIQPRAVHS